MSDSGIFFDHVHILSEDPQSAATWYVDKLGGEILSRLEELDLIQLHVSFQGASIIIRNQRIGEQVSRKSGSQWGSDHFGFYVNGDFDGYCDNLRQKGVAFTLEPVDIRAGVRIAYIAAPDGVSIELLQRK